MADTNDISLVPWLVRISPDFEDIAGEILAGLGAGAGTRLAEEYRLTGIADPAAFQRLPAAAFLRWNLPVGHAWPCNPETMTGFVEKAAQALARKFAAERPQALRVGQLDPSASRRYYKMLASNLRGRALQIFPRELATAGEAETQDPALPTLFCLVGEKGLFAGMQSPRLAGGFHSGGTKFIAQSGPDTVSRAGAKVAGALHRLLLDRPPVAAGSHWLELGASPGGMTSELLGRGFRVTAIDRAALDKRLDGRAGLTFARMDVAGFRPNAGMIYDAMLCDMNGPAAAAITEVARLAANLRRGAVVIFTLKMAGAESYAEMAGLLERAVETAGKAGLGVISAGHLAFNRREVTMFFEKKE